MDLTFSTLDPEATDSPTITAQKIGVTWRSVVTAASEYSASSLPSGAVFDTDANAPEFDTDSNQVTVSAD